MNNDHLLNRATPGLNRVKLGDVMSQMITEHNALVAKFNALVESTYLKDAVVVTAPALTIKAGGSAVVKSEDAFSALCGGVLVSKDADQDMAALSGDVANAKSAVYSFYIDSDGTLTSDKGDDADTEEAAVAALPATPANKALLGYVIVTNASGSTFTGDTTALDAADITATYVDAGAAPVAASLAETTSALLNDR